MENGILVVQVFGDLPVRLKKQANGSFIPEGQGSPYTFAIDGNEMRLTITATGYPSSVNTGLKAGYADARTFRTIAFCNLIPKKNCRE